MKLKSAPSHLFSPPTSSSHAEFPASLVTPTTPLGCPLADFNGATESSSPQGRMNAQHGLFVCLFVMFSSKRFSSNYCSLVTPKRVRKKVIHISSMSHSVYQYNKPSQNNKQTTRAATFSGKNNNNQPSQFDERFKRQKNSSS